MNYNWKHIIQWKAPVVRPASAVKGYSHPVAIESEGTIYLFYTVWNKETNQSCLEVSVTEDFIRYGLPTPLFGGGAGENMNAEEMEYLQVCSVVEEGDWLQLSFLVRSPANGQKGCYRANLDREALREGKVLLQGAIEADDSNEALRMLETDRRSEVSETGSGAACREQRSVTDESVQPSGELLWKGKALPCWAEGFLGAGSLLHLKESKLQICFYWGCAREAGKRDGSIALAVSRDGVHWMTFQRDCATYPEHGVIYDGDYYKAIPFRQYLSREELPGEKVFDIREFGAVPNTLVVSTEAFRAAAEAARDAGGGTILVTGGYYCVGSVFLYDHTTLFIDEDSALCASKDLDAFQDALLACVNGKDITIRGGGKIIGNGEYFAYLSLKKPLLEPMAATKLPAVLYDPMGYPVDTIRYAYRSRIRYAEDRYGEGLPVIQRPMYTVWIRGCEGITIENVVIEDSLDWTLSIDFSKKVQVKNVVINGNRHVANTDGIDIMSSEDITVEHCFISCADDGLCIKAPRTQGHDGINVEDPSLKMGPSRNIHISDCTVMTVMNAFKIGTETFYDIEDVTVENCRFQMPDMYPGSVSGISIESADGSRVRNIQVRNIEMDGVCCPIFIDLCMRNKFGLPDESNSEEPFFGGIEQIRIENVICRNVEVPSIITGFCAGEKDNCVEGRIRDIEIRGFRASYRDNEEILDIRTPVYENVRDYPENNAFGDVPAYGFYLRHGDQIVLEDYEITPRTEYHDREAVVWENCN